MVSDEQVASDTCDHDMEDAMIDAIGPPKLGPRKADGSADIEPSDEKSKIPGSRCAKCGLEVPKNTAVDRAPRVVFECLLGRGRPCRVVGVPYRAYEHIDTEAPDGMERYVVEQPAHPAAMGEPAWKTVTDHVQLLTVIRALIESRAAPMEGGGA